MSWISVSTPPDSALCVGLLGGCVGGLRMAGWFGWLVGWYLVVCWKRLRWSLESGAFAVAGWLMDWLQGWYLVVWLVGGMASALVFGCLVGGMVFGCQKCLWWSLGG